MRVFREPDKKGLAGLFVALSVMITLLSLPAMASAAPTGTNFNHIVIIAMENQNYGSVIGSSSAPFINSLAALGTTISNYHSYGQNIGGCSAGCYEAFTSGQQSHSDSWCPRASSPCYTIPNIADQLHTAGLTSAMFCEDGCPRGADHFPWIAYTSTWNSCLAASGGISCNGQTGPDGNLLYNSQSSGGNTAFINYLNSATPSNYIWFTPTDSHNMHDNSVSTGDAYLQTLLVGTGTLSNPSSNSVLGSTLFKTPGTFLYLWWDEYDPSPNVEYGSMIKIGYTSTGGYTEYDSLHTIEANWGLPYLTSVVSGDSGMTDIFGSTVPLPLASSFTYLPTTPIASASVSFTGVASGGTPPYTYSWAFGDGGTGTGLTTSHTYSTAGNYTVTLTVSDSVAGSAKSTQTVTVLPVPALSASFMYVPTNPLANTLISFTATATGGTSPYAYAWNFGDGATGTGLTTTHAYSAAGNYNANLTVTDSASGSAKSSQIVSVASIPPLTSSFAFTPSQPTTGQSITFSGTATGGVSPYIFSWNFGDGGTSTSQNPTHTYSTSGTFTVSLNVTDAAVTHSLTSQSVSVSPPGAPTASFVESPSIPVSGQTVTFTATITGGTSPYTYSWNLGGTSKTGNPASQSLTNGTYTIALTVTDSASMSVTVSQTLVVLPNVGSTTVPVLVGWGGIRLDEAAVGGGVNQPTNPPNSLVFPGEKASNMELLLIELKAMGYNTVRVDFDPSCTGSQYMSTYSATNAQRAIQIAQYFGFWIILDYHGYSDVFNSSTASCWLNFWSGVTSQFKNSYSKIIWEPINEPCYDASSCAGYSTNNDMCSGASACVTTLSHEYQLWIDQTRAQGDTHWIVVQNICSYGCSLSNWASGYPTVTDPLGPLPQGRIFISLHSYMGYSSSNWNNATADSMAQQYYQAVIAGMAATGWPALNTEGGADPLCTSCAPDQILTGSAGYTTVTFHFIQALTNLYDSNTPQRINWIWWPAGSWTNTPGSGIYGAMQCASTPPGWGCLLKFLGLAPPGPDFTITTSSPSGVNAGQSASSTITTAAQNGFTGTITLTDVPPAGLTCGAITPSTVTGSGTATVSCNSNVAGTYLLTIIGTSGSLVHITVTTYNFLDFGLSATSPAAVAPGSSSISSITLNAINGFAGTITISDNVPSGLTCGSITPSSVTGSGTATLSCSSATQNVYTVTINAINGGLTHTTTASFTFGVPPDFTIIATSPNSVNVGSSTSSTITIALIHGLTGTLTLTDTIPSGLSCNSITQTSFTGNGTTTVSCSSTIPASYKLTITGTSGKLSHTTTATFTFLGTHISTALTLTVPGAQSATVGSTLRFTIYATNTLAPTENMTLTATGLAPNMIFDPASGTLAFTPSQSQAGQTFIINFTATDPNNSSATSSKSVTIHVANAAAPPPTGGFCLNCLLPRGMTTTAWLLAIGALIGVLASIALLHIRATAELASAKRRVRSLNSRNQVGRADSNNETPRRATSELRRRPNAAAEDN